MLREEKISANLMSLERMKHDIDKIPLGCPLMAMAIRQSVRVKLFPCLEGVIVTD